MLSDLSPVPLAQFHSPFSEYRLFTTPQALVVPPAGLGVPFPRPRQMSEPPVPGAQSVLIKSLEF